MRKVPWKRPARTTAVGAAFLLTGIASALAYLQTNLVDQPGFPDLGVFQTAGTLVLRLEQDASFRITDGSDLTTLQASMQRWTNVATSNANIIEGTRFNLTSPIDAGAALGNDGTNRLYFAETDAGSILQNAIAISFFYVAADGHITDCDTVFNERLYTFSTATPADPNQILGPNTYDLGEIATHEMGHCLGLDHSAVAGVFAATGLEVSGFSSGDFTYQATMYPFGSRTIQGRSLSQDDIAGVSFIYPNSTLTSTTGKIQGRVLDGGTGSPIKGAHVVAVSTAAPDVPIAGVLSDVQAGGAGGEYTLVGLPPGSYYLRLEPMVGTSNPFTDSRTHLTGFDTAFPPEYYDGPTESGFDTPTARQVLSVAAGQTFSNINFLTNVASPDPNEPNNTRAAATPAACEQIVSASVVPLGDIDYYAVPITGITTLQVDINAARSGSPLDAIAGVFNAAGVRLGFADNTVSLDPILSVNLQVPGTYYVAVASFNDGAFTGTDARTVGNYTMTLHCSVPTVPPGTCHGRILYAASNADGTIKALADADHDLHFEAETTFASDLGTGQGLLTSRRDGGICEGNLSQDLRVLHDDTGDSRYDRLEFVPTPIGDTRTIASSRSVGVEYLYAGDLFSGGPILEMRDSGGDVLPELTTAFVPAPQSVLAVSKDEAGTLYTLELLSEGGQDLVAYRDLDGDGVYDFSRVFLADALAYVNIAARRPGEVYGQNNYLGQIDRIVDRDLNGTADSVVPFATGLSLDSYYGLAFDESDVLYTVEGGNRVLALPDLNGDGVADQQIQFSPLIPILAGITFGPGPPEAVSQPGSLHPFKVSQAGSALRLTWEDQGPTVPAYNIYEGTIGNWYSHAPLLCHVTGNPDGAGNRFLDVTPSGGNRYYLVTAGDSCGEGSPGRDGSGRRRPMPQGTCGASP